jgi:ubiquinone/menaquinone biosynthesis C-methylase UbiE
MQTTPKSWDRIFRTDGRIFTEAHESLSEFIALLPAPPARVLDLGCGSGRHMVALAKHGYHMTGMDRARHGMTLARTWLAEEGLKDNGLCEQDFHYPLPFAAASFHGLISTQVVHHALLADIQNIITEIYRVLKPGGVVFVTTTLYPPGRPNIKEIEPFTYVPQEGSERGLPHHYFDEARLRQVFSAFNILKIFTDATRHLCILAKKPESETTLHEL